MQTDTLSTTAVGGFIGSTLFYVLISLVLIAAILYFARRRKADDTSGANPRFGGGGSGFDQAGDRPSRGPDAQ